MWISVSNRKSIKWTDRLCGQLYKKKIFKTDHLRIGQLGYLNNQEDLHKFRTMPSERDLLVPSKKKDQHEPLVTKTMKGQKKKRALIQIILVSVACMLLNSPFTTLMNLEAIINPTAGLYAMAFVYGGCLITIIAAPWLKKYLRDKDILLLNAAIQSLFLLAHFYPETYLLLPLATIYGTLGTV